MEKVKQKLDEVSNGNVPVTFECRIPASPGNTRNGDSSEWVLISAHMETDPEPRTICWITVITAQKHAEEVLRRRMDEAIEMKRQQERFIDMTSHEIRNPLSAMIHCADEIIENCRNKSAGLIESSLEAAYTIDYCAQHIRE